MCITDDQRRKIRPFVLLLAVIALAVIGLFIINGYLFPSEVSSNFEDEKTFIEWYRKALEAYQTAASLFSVWAASCIVAGYTLVKDLTRNDRFLKTSVYAFIILVFLSIFDLYLSQAYFSYYTYVFKNTYPVFASTLTQHIETQKFTHLCMFITLSFLSGVYLIRKLT